MQIYFLALQRVSHVRVRVLIDEEWESKYRGGDVLPNSNEAGQVEPLNSTNPPFPIAAAFPPLWKEDSLLFPEEPVITSPEIFCLVKNC